MDPVSLALVVYSTQILLVVSIAAMAAFLCRESHPALPLIYWRSVGAVCLALPLLAVGHVDQPGLSVSFVPGTMAPRDAFAAESTPLSLGAGVLWTWILGTVVCLVRLLTGAWCLRRLRRDTVSALLDDDIETLRVSVAPRAEFRWSKTLEQPVTFGIFRPVILLPGRFRELSADARRAVAHHELLHVARRDWLWIVLEEHARALFWFHPAVWWLVEQVQLAREQVIDRVVVSSDVSKRAYMAALLTFADPVRVSRLSIAFLRRGHLKSRFRQLAKEPDMSFKRLVWTTALLAVVIGGAALGAARALPLDVPALGLQAGAARLEIRLAETAAAAGLREAVVAGSALRVYLHPETLATDADVTSARVVDMGGQFGVGVQFSGTASARMLSDTTPHLGRPVAIVLDGTVIAAPTLRAPISDSAVISGTFTAASAQELATQLAPVRRGQNGATRDGLTLPVPIHQERAEYTQAAMAAGIEGSVLLETVVLADGSVGGVTVIKSLDRDLGLDQRAVDALKLWTWKPGTRDGEPVRVAVQVEMTFTLK